MIEADIEAKVITALNGLGIADSQVVGAWSIASSGDAKNEEYANAAVLIGVAVSPRAYDTFEIPSCNVTASIAITVRADLDPTGAKFADAAAKVFALLNGWQADMAAVTATFTVTDFNPAGFRLDGGNAPERDAALNVWTVSQGFTIRGVIN